MLINNLNAKLKYNLTLNEKKITPSSTTCNLQWPKGALTPILLDVESKFLDLECKCTIESNTEEEFWEKFSDFTKDTIECIIKFNNINMLYKCYIKEIKEPIRITPCNWEFTCSWVGYKFSNLVQVKLIKETEKTIRVKGTKETPVIVEITPNIEQVDFKIEGLSKEPITVKNLHANKKIIIDSIENTVLEEGTNKFKDVDLWEFPFLNVGINKIKLSNSNNTVILKYNPRYL